MYTLETHCNHEPNDPVCLQGTMPSDQLPDPYGYDTLTHSYGAYTYNPDPYGYSAPSSYGYNTATHSYGGGYYDPTMNYGPSSYGYAPEEPAYPPHFVDIESVDTLCAEEGKGVHMSTCECPGGYVYMGVPDGRNAGAPIGPIGGSISC